MKTVKTILSFEDSLGTLTNGDAESVLIATVPNNIHLSTSGCMSDINTWCLMVMKI